MISRQKLVIHSHIFLMYKKDGNLFFLQRYKISNCFIIFKFKVAFIRSKGLDRQPGRQTDDPILRVFFS